MVSRIISRDRRQTSWGNISQPDALISTDKHQPSRQKPILPLCKSPHPAEADGHGVLHHPRSPRNNWTALTLKRNSCFPHVTMFNPCNPKLVPNPSPSSRAIYLLYLPPFLPPPRYSLYPLALLPPSFFPFSPLPFSLPSPLCAPTIPKSHRPISQHHHNLKTHRKAKVYAVTNPNLFNKPTAPLWGSPSCPKVARQVRRDRVRDKPARRWLPP